MVSISNIIEYIRRRLGVPFVSIEFNDETIAEIIREDVLPVFTEYVPDTNRILIDKDIRECRVDENIENLFWIRDPDGRTVRAVLEVSQDYNSWIAQNYPYLMPITNFDDLQNIVLRMNNSIVASKFSKSDLVWCQERDLNQVWIYCSESLASLFSILYSRSHARDLSTIPENYVAEFKDLCLASVKTNIGTIRKSYSEIGTPIGNLNLNTDLYSEGNELYNATIEKLEKKQPIFTSVYVG